MSLHTVARVMTVWNVAHVSIATPIRYIQKVWKPQCYSYSTGPEIYGSKQTMWEGMSRA